ncbi:MAG: hypothetical protein KAS73_03975 [Candidatus Sabulitectum sp.]|nr:hypothetical protein [Candidatus Sabulitectum sp.]
MALNEDRDFVMADELTYVGPAGLGKGTMLGTHDQLLLMPVEIVQVSGYRHYRTETKTWSLEGKDPGEMIRNFVSEDGVSTSDLNGMMKDIAAQMNGAVLHDLSQMRRLKVKNSLFSRGIYLNKKDSNVGWTGYPLKKQDAVAFQEFYRGHPAAQQ